MRLVVHRHLFNRRQKFTGSRVFFFFHFVLMCFRKCQWVWRWSLRRWVMLIQCFKPAEFLCHRA